MKRYDPVTALVVFFLATVGTIVRIVPLLDPGGRLLRQFPTEDGYFMLTIARNMALGHGMTVAGGEIPTNGTQPLATYLWSLIFRLVDADRNAGVGGVLVLELLIAAATTYVLYRIGRRFFPSETWYSGPAALAAGAWYASPVAVPHTMNCLETGIYGLFVATCLERFSADSALTRARGIVTFGVLLGLTFWARNDAVFLVLGLCLAHWWSGGRIEGLSRARAFAQTIWFGAISVIVAIPWLVYNHSMFGSIVPISGQSEAMGANLADNLHLLPITLFEYSTVLVPIPHDWESSGVVVTITTALGLIGLPWALLGLWRRCDSRGRATILAAGIFGLGLSAYYGFVFGAGWFVNRYLFPLSIPLTLMWMGTVALAWTRRPWNTRISALAAGLTCLLVLALHVRAHRAGPNHAHFQVVEWVQQNVPDSTWVGAPQAGTLGYFHDRTLNLDGKVNPAALKARQEDRLMEYAVQSDIEYIVDWAGMAGWVEDPILGRHFELIVHDPARNLAVLRRRTMHVPPQVATNE